MKTKFNIGGEIFFSGNGTMAECIKIYEKHYKEDGWQINKEEEEVFMIIDEEINLNEGDRVSVMGIRVIAWKCVHVIEKIIEYSLEDE
jgi:hypothetical protein